MPRVIRVPAQALSPRRLSPLRILLIAIGAIALCAGAWGLWKWQSLHSGMPRLPEVSELWQAQREAAIEFIDAEGNTLAVRGPRYGRAHTRAARPQHHAPPVIAAADKPG